MRFNCAPMLKFVLVTFVLATSCKQASVKSVSTVKVDANKNMSESIHTTYYPYKNLHAEQMGPGYFNCAEFNSETQWYIAPSDTFNDPRVWSGPPCPSNGGGIPQCSTHQQTCGVKLKVTCTTNCKSDAPPVVVMITDVCPKEHPTNKESGACQGGNHFDIAKPVWELMHDRDNNVSVRYEVVDSATPLGPTDGKPYNQSSPNTDSDPSERKTNPTSQFIVSSNAAMFGNGSSGSSTSGNGRSNTSSGTSPQSVSPQSSGSASGNNKGKWCDPQNASFCAPYCTNGSNTGNNFGWQPDLKGPNGGSCRVP